MRLGVVYPQSELGGDPAAARQFIAAIDAADFDHIVTFDHPLGALHADRDPPLTGPYTLDDPFHEPFVFLTVVAMLTRRMELMPGVLVLPQRQTALVAKQAAELQLFSDGRLVLGVGSGWNWVEYQALGRDFARRGASLDEQVPLLRRLWSEPWVTHHGEFDHIERAGLNPRPRKPIPIWFGGSKEPGFRRAGRLGDGFHFGLRPNLTLDEQWGRILHHLREAGRDETSFSRNLIVGERQTGPNDAADLLRRWRDNGHSHGTIHSAYMGFDSLQAHLDYIGAIAEEVRRG